MFFYDSTYLLIIIAMVIVGYAQHRVQSTFNKYSELETSKRVTGQQVASFILQQTGLTNVRVEGIPGHLTDHYDPRSKILRLSEATYQQDSVAAIAVAAHECGHAIQDAENYSFLKLRSAIAPVVQIGSTIAMPMIFIGFILQIMGLVQFGIIAFSAVLVFQLVTLPVEFDASKKALRILEDTGVLAVEEIGPAKKVLDAAAFTYIAATMSSALQIIRLVMLTRRRR